MRIMTFGLWLVSLAALSVAALIAAQIGVMATSINPVDIATNGLDSWRDALTAASCFAGLGIATAVALRLWHSVRFKAIALLLTAIDVAGVAWATGWFYREYF